MLRMIHRFPYLAYVFRYKSLDNRDGAEGNGTVSVESGATTRAFLLFKDQAADDPDGEEQQGHRDPAAGEFVNQLSNLEREERKK